MFRVPDIVQAAPPRFMAPGVVGTPEDWKYGTPTGVVRGWFVTKLDPALLWMWWVVVGGGVVVVELRVNTDIGSGAVKVL